MVMYHSLMHSPCSRHTKFDTLLTKYHCLFKSVPALANHHIPTTGNPVCIPPRQIPAHYKEEVEYQFHQMPQKGVIEEGSSPWMAPVVMYGSEVVKFACVLIIMN